MINRLKELGSDPEDAEPEVDFWEVTGDCDVFYVDAEAARAILAELRRIVPPRRIRFVDLFGAEVSLSTSQIWCVVESKSAHRTAKRRFQRARRDERKAERRPWDDDDW